MAEVSIGNFNLEDGDYTRVEYADGKFLKVIRAADMVTQGSEHSTRRIIRSVTHYTGEDVDQMDYADVIALMELIDECLEERANYTEDADGNYYVELLHPIEIASGIPLTHITMRRPKGRDMLVNDEDDEATKLIIKRVAMLCGLPRTAVRKMAWVDVATCIELFRKKI